MKSALWESNPPVQLGRLTPWPIGQGHMFLFKAEAVGLEPTTGVSPAPAFEAGSSSSRMTSICCSCGDRNRTCVTTVNSRLPVPARTPPQCVAVSVVGFEPTFSCARSARRVHNEQGQTFPHAEVRSRPSANDIAPSGSRTHTSALARRYAAATS